MENHTLEDLNKVGGMEKESTSGQTEADRLHTMLITREKEQPSTMIKMEMNKTNFTRMVRELKNNLSKFAQFSFNLVAGSY